MYNLNRNDLEEALKLVNFCMMHLHSSRWLLPAGERNLRPIWCSAYRWWGTNRAGPDGQVKLHLVCQMAHTLLEQYCLEIKHSGDDEW